MGVLDIEGAIISSEFCEMEVLDIGCAIVSPEFYYMEVLDIGGAIIFLESGVFNHINNEEFDG